jgi:ABC-type amino acid transport substrate-binding protein
MRESEITMRDRWRIPAAAAIAAAAVLTSACGPQYEPVSPNPFPEGSTMHEIAAAGTIKLGASPNQPGLADLNLEQQWEGFNVDLAVHLVGSLGLEAEDIQWVNTTAANRIPYIEQGKIDLFVTALAITPEREEAIAIAGPYMDAVPQLIMRVDDAAAVQTLEDISPGTKVCVLQGSQGQPRVSESIPQAEIVEFNVLTNCIRALEQGTDDLRGGRALGDRHGGRPHRPLRVLRRAARRGLRRRHGRRPLGPAHGRFRPRRTRGARGDDELLSRRIMRGGIAS